MSLTARMALLLLSLTSSLDAAEVIVVCPPEWRPAMEPWRELRQSQGHSLTFIVPKSTVRETLAALQQASFINDEQRAGSVSDWSTSTSAPRRGPTSAGSTKYVATKRYVVLVGDAPGESLLATDNQVPTGFVPAKINRRWGSEPTIVTDSCYTDTTGDGQPDASVGRIPVDTPAELRAYLRRVLAHEAQGGGPLERMPIDGMPIDGMPIDAMPIDAMPIDGQRLTVVAAPGNFSPLLDRVIETTAVGIFHQLTPPECDLHVTYADWRSPYCPYPPAMPQAIRASLTQRSLAWVYLGHGLRHEVDILRTPLGHARILHQEFTSQLDGEQFPPLAVLVACYTGALDGSDDCLAEAMLKAPGGPLVVLAGSRVTMPYGNSVLGLELLRGLFNREMTTAGEMVAAAKARAVAGPAKNSHQAGTPRPTLRQTVESIASMVTPSAADRTAERREHVKMYNLLGDPLLRVRRPRQLRLVAQREQGSSRRAVVTGQSPIAGMCQIRLVRPRAVNSVRGQRAKLELGDAAAREFTDCYTAANNRTICERTTPVEIGEFQAMIELPKSAVEEPHEVVATITGAEGLAIGHAVVK